MSTQGAAAGWQAASLCHGLQKSDRVLWEAFFADTTADRKLAKLVCTECPVRLECLTDALERGETWGVWGGCDEVDLRRALWIDSNGTERERLRFPRCPACRARPENLYVLAQCALDGGQVMESVECCACAFSWSAATSVAAVRAFWAARPADAVVVPLKKPARVRVPRGRVPSGATGMHRSRVALPSPQRAPEPIVEAVAASGVPQSF